MTEGKIIFLLGDDHQIVRQGLSFVINDLFPNSEIKHAPTLNDVLLKAQVGPIDIAVLDAQFPDGNSISIIKKLRELQPAVKILIFTSSEEEHFALRFLREGANGFLSKLSEESEIETALAEMVNNGNYLPPLTRQMLAESAVNPENTDPLSKLTDRELEVADLLAQGLGNLEVANHLDLRQNTVSTFKKRIFSKLNVENMVDFIELMRIIRPSGGR
ncbi:DNA-binding response regulator, LuxR family [Flavobacteriaceae bacterium 3519-10]|nr:DNA-binding response regulator, LuxR family [Flavobacteriaceae bacterium 3519-10]